MDTQKKSNKAVPEPSDEALLKLPEVMAICKRSRSSVYSAVRQGTFPAPVKIGVRSTAWVKSEITAWLNECISGRDAAN